MPDLSGGHKKKEFYQIKKEVTCTIEKRIAVISTSAKGFSKEVNLVSWNGENAKLDIREWKPDGTALKGNTYTPEEGRALLGILTALYADKNNDFTRKD